MKEQVQLIVHGKKGIHQITNLLGMTSELAVMSDISGEVLLTATQYIRVLGRENQPEAIFSLLERNDIEVMVNDMKIFDSQHGWNGDLAIRVLNECVPIEDEPNN